MDGKTPSAEEFNPAQFEKRLQSLKDSQDSINSCCQWCLENRVHHKKIVTSWLNVLKRVKVEQRVTLFYLANDVIQYSKRRNYDFAESWSTTLQKATPMVRDERVKHKILRIFNIWEQRGVYNEEFIADLSGLISATPSVRKSDDAHEFQSSYLVNKIRNCSNLESDTDNKLKKLKDHNPKIHIDAVELCSSLKDRAHVDDVEKEIDEYVIHMESYVEALKSEIKARSNLITLLVQAETQLENDRKDVKLVANAYKAFGTRVKNVKKKLDEILPNLLSPIPSPDINAPSPSPDSDIDFPIMTESSTNNKTSSVVQYPNAGYYNPVSEHNSSFVNNGFSSFLESGVNFNMQDFNATSLFTPQSSQTNTGATTQTTNSFNLNNSISSLFSSISQPPLPPEALPPPVAAPIQGVPPPVPAPMVTNYQGVPPPPTDANFQYGSNHLPLLPPPPMPPFNKADGGYESNSSYNDSYGNSANFVNNALFDADPYQHSEDVFNSPEFANPYPPSAESDFQSAFHAESETEAWDSQNPPDWIPVNSDTPESPPMFEKEAFSDPIEYHDNLERKNGRVDVDHRVLPTIPSPILEPDIGLGHRSKDVDHRNLISLTGSPAGTPPSAPPPANWSTSGDQDYRMAPPPVPTTTVTGTADQDYRVSTFDIEQLKLPPPPPPPPKTIMPPIKPPFKKPGNSPRKLQDNVESIDMDLSDDDPPEQLMNENLRLVVDPTKDLGGDLPSPVVDMSEPPPVRMLEPPPPFPDLPEDVDAQNFLDDLDNDLNCDDFTAELSDETPPQNMFTNQVWNHPPPPPPQPIFPPGPNMSVPPPWMMEQPPGFNGDFRGGRGNGMRGNFNNRGWGGNNGEFRGRGGPRPFRGGNSNFRGNQRGRGGPNNNRGGFKRGGRNFRRNFRGRF